MKYETEKIHWEEIKKRIEKGQEDLGKVFSPDPSYIGKVYYARAQQLTKRGQKETLPVRHENVMVFLKGGERYGVGLSSLSGVSRFESCTPVPAAPSYLLGVINLKGEIRPVLDLSVILGCAKQNGNPSGSILLLRVQNKECGIQADAVEGVKIFSVDDFKDISHETKPETLHYIKNITDDQTILLDVEKLIQEVQTNFKERNLS